ncbi:GNAT family N-acetyltransferase [Idiomarina aminovorans]|uniref:GNAT family N-acetyltransferase n=1 Tax=Idiomarina aminovorans TaxID=2914829 RepID=UPI00200573E3|nr:GNAT family N-acetyltransferase [Idiomarina sp. ATCH4]MCK7459445.1 GNAT family N-acetyltransferase [Idiomarina sp. ATCH4]
MTTEQHQNLHNLHQLWRLQPYQELTTSRGLPFYKLEQWPARAWCQPGNYSEAEKTHLFAELSTQMSASHTLSMPEALLPKGEPGLNSLALSFSQQMMTKNLDASAPGSAFPHLALEPTGPQQAQQWAITTGKCFGYMVAASSVTNLLHGHALLYFIVYQSGIAGTAMTFTHNQQMGIHQVGVIDQYRGKGLAREAMLLLEQLALSADINTLQLQASAMGQPLYHSLGYRSLGAIHNYVK